MKLQKKMWVDARPNDLADSQYFGINPRWIKAGKLHGKAAVGLHTDEYISSGAIRESRNAAKKLNPLFLITLVEDLGLVFDGKTLAYLIIYEGLQIQWQLSVGPAAPAPNHR